MLPGRRSRSEPRAAPQSPLCRHRGFRRVSSCPCTSLAHARRGEGEYRPPWQAGGVGIWVPFGRKRCKAAGASAPSSQGGRRGRHIKEESRQRSGGSAGASRQGSQSIRTAANPASQHPPGTNIGLKNDTSRRGRSRRARVPAPISSALSPADRGPSFAFAVGFLARMQMKVPSFAALVCSPSFLPPAGIAAPQVLFHHPTRLSKPSPGPRGSGALPRAQKTPLGSEAKLQKGNEAFW